MHNDDDSENNGENVAETESDEENYHVASNDNDQSIPKISYTDVVTGNVRPTSKEISFSFRAANYHDNRHIEFDLQFQMEALKLRVGILKMAAVAV